MEVAHGVAAAGLADVHQMDQQARALDVTQELDAQAMAVMRALDQTWDVGHHERGVIVVRADDAEVRLKRSKRVIGNLWLRRRDARDQRGLAGVGEPDQSDVGKEFQFETQLAFLAGLPSSCSVGA